MDNLSKVLKTSYMTIRPMMRLRNEACKRFLHLSALIRVLARKPEEADFAEPVSSLASQVVGCGQGKMRNWGQRYDIVAISLRTVRKIGNPVCRKRFGGLLPVCLLTLSVFEKGLGMCVGRFFRLEGWVGPAHGSGLMGLKVGTRKI